MDFKERAYLADPYKMKFTSRVRFVKEVEDSKSRVYLDRTYFYPVSGGQPDDRGFLGGNCVLGVNEDSEGVSHLIEGSLEKGTAVDCRVEYERRYDHMRQHSGQHLLSRLFVDILDLDTVGFHMGEAVSTIDLDGEMPSAESLKNIDIESNKLIMKNLAISSSVVSAEEFKKLCSDKSSNCLPHLKFSGNVEDVRLVEIHGMDLNPCCGTHVSNTGEIGIIKITGAKRVKKNSRIEFLCGLRGIRDYIEKDMLLNTLALSFSTGWSEVGEMVKKLSDENAAIRKENKVLDDKLIALRAEQLSIPDSSIGSFSIIKKIVKDIDAEALRNLAGEIKKTNKVIVLFGVLKPAPGLVFACSEGVSVSMGRILKEAAAVMGAHGGGGGDFAQGGGGNGEMIQDALDKAESLIKEELEE